MKLSQIGGKNEEKVSESLGSLKTKKFGNLEHFLLNLSVLLVNLCLFLKKVGFNSWAQQSATEKSSCSQSQQSQEPHKVLLHTAQHYIDILKNKYELK